jgi:hypothetical protein
MIDRPDAAERLLHVAHFQEGCAALVSHAHAPVRLR